MNPRRIFVYGVPGAGKTTYTLGLEKQTGYSPFEADTIRIEAQKDKTKEQDPFVYLGTTGAFRQFGELTKENAINGLKAVRKSFAPYVAREVEKSPNHLIMEGAFLDPAELENKGNLTLLITTQEKTHRARYFSHRDETLENIEDFMAARIIQDFLVEEAKRFPIDIVENVFDFKSI